MSEYKIHRQITTPVPVSSAPIRNVPIQLNLFSFYRPDALPAAQPTASKH